MRIKITIEQGGTVLTEAKVQLDDPRELSTAIKAEVDKVPWQDRSGPLWGIIVKIDQPSPED